MFLENIISTKIQGKLQEQGILLGRILGDCYSITFDDGLVIPRTTTSKISQSIICNIKTSITNRLRGCKGVRQK